MPIMNFDNSDSEQELQGQQLQREQQQSVDSVQRSRELAEMSAKADRTASRIVQAISLVNLRRFIGRG